MANSPVNLIDPDGFFAILFPPVVIIGIIGIVAIGAILVTNPIIIRDAGKAIGEIIDSLPQIDYRRIPEPYPIENPEQSPQTTDPIPPIPVSKDTIDRCNPNSCKKKYPNYELCTRFPYKSIEATIGAMKKHCIDEGFNHDWCNGLKKHNPAKSEACNGGDEDKQGMHYNIKGGKILYCTALCCPCCIENEGNPTIVTKCKTQ